MVKKKEDDIPEWVTDEIQKAKFKKPVEMKQSGYILEFYYDDNKIDVQLYDGGRWTTHCNNGCTKDNQNGWFTKR